MKQNYYRQQRGSTGNTSTTQVPPLQFKRQLSTNKISQPQPSIGSHLRQIMKQQFVPNTHSNSAENEIIRTQETKLQEVPVELQDIKMYTILSSLGHGATAEVNMARHKMLDIVVAIKVYGTNANTEQLQQEVDILQQLAHPNIIKLYYKLQNKQTIYLIQEYFSPMTMDTFMKGRTIKRLNEDQVKIIAKQLVNAVLYLHSLHILHRDLKLENILIDPQSLKIKLIDFGYSIKSEVPVKTPCGTPSYMAPEIIKQQPYDDSVDIWACGVLIFRLLTGVFPFRANSEPELNKKIIQGKLEFPSFVSNPAKTMLQSMINVNPQQRQLIGFDFLI